MSVESNMFSTLTSWWDGQSRDLHGLQREGADGAPLLHFLHGNGFSAHTLVPMADALPSGWNLLLTDVPGHGGSQQPAHHMPDWLRMARRVGDALEVRNGGRKAIGIGHSMGGVMTLMLAAERPHLFERIILLDPVLFSAEILLFQRLARKTGLWKRGALVKAVQGRRSVWPDAASLRQDLQRKSLYRNWDAAALEGFILGATKPTSEGLELACNPAWEAAIFGSYPRGLWQAVHRVRVPVDILVAADSYPFILKSARKAAKANQHIRFEMAPGSHCFPMEQPEQTAQRIKELLAINP